MIDCQEKMELYFNLKDTPESSRESYLRRIKLFQEFIRSHNKEIDNFTLSDVQQYILYLKKKELSAGTVNNYISAIRFFYTHVLDQEWNKKKVPRMKRTENLPVIPFRQDVLLILNGTAKIKYKAIFALIYGSGLRVSEVARLRICDICSKTMTVRVEKAKHDTNRLTILSETALQLLRDYFKANFTTYKPEDWLFPGRVAGEHLNVKSIKNTLIKLRNKLQLDPKISAHTLRHCFAVHLLENGTEPVLIQQMLGHRNLNTTTKYYLRLTSKSLMGVKSPLDSGSVK